MINQITTKEKLPEDKIDNILINGQFYINWKEVEFQYKNYIGQKGYYLCASKEIVGDKYKSVIGLIIKEAKQYTVVLPQKHTGGTPFNQKLYLTLHKLSKSSVYEIQNFYRTKRGLEPIDIKKPSTEELKKMIKQKYPNAITI